MSGRGTTIKQILMIGGLLVLVVLVMDFNSRMGELLRLSEQSEQVSSRATDKIQTRVYLETQIAFATSDAAVEEWARVQGHMIQEGDHPVVPVAPTQPVVRTAPTPQVLTETASNLDFWIALFFDRAP
jgi:hypothetical protein